MALVSVSSVSDKIKELTTLSEELERILDGIIKLNHDKGIKYDVEIERRGECTIGIQTSLLAASKNLRAVKDLLELELAEVSVDLKSAYW